MSPTLQQALLFQLAREAYNITAKNVQSTGYNSIIYHLTQGCQSLCYRRSSPLFWLQFKTPLGVEKTPIFPLLKSLERFIINNLLQAYYGCSIFVKVFGNSCIPGKQSLVLHNYYQEITTQLENVTIFTRPTLLRFVRVRAHKTCHSPLMSP